MSAVWQLREWFTIAEGATYLSTKVRSPIEPADILRLALDGHLPLSVRLPASVDAFCRDDATQRFARRTTIQGICELLMQDAGRLEIESIYAAWRRLPYVHVDGKTGALVTTEGVVCQLPPEPGTTGIYPRSPSAIPHGGVLVVRKEALDAFADGLPATPSTPAAPPELLETPLEWRERATLLTIIAVLAEELKIDISKPAKAGVVIEELTVRKGARVSARSVQDHLNRIPEALERRSKLSD